MRKLIWIVLLVVFISCNNTTREVKDMAVYEYGTGATYATVQDAIDACQVANEIAGTPQPFTEVNYIRGVTSEVFEVGGGGEICQLGHFTTGRTLLPSKEFPLYIDAAPGAYPKWKFHMEPNNPAQTVGVSNVIMDGIGFDCNVGAGSAMIVPGTITVGNITIKNCYTVGNYMPYFVVVDGTLTGLTLDGNRSFGGRLLIVNGGVVNGLLLFRNNTFAGIDFDPDTGRAIEIVGDNDFALGLIHNSFYCSGTCVHIEEGTLDTGHMFLLNNILHSVGGDAIYFDGVADLQMPLGSGNVLYAPNGHLVEDVLNGITLDTIEEVEARYIWDNTNLNMDPQFNNPPYDLSLVPGASILSRGRAAAPAGIEGNERATTIDPGAYQYTPTYLKATLRDNHIIVPGFTITVEPEL